VAEPAEPNPDQTPQVRERSGFARRRLLILSVLGLVAVISVAALVALTLLRTAPSWWRTYRPGSERLLERAERFERHASAVLSEVRPRDPSIGPGDPYRSVPWRVSISDEEASVWLSTRLPKWIADRSGAPPWPDSFTALQVHFEREVMHAGVRYTDPALGSRILSLRMQPVDAGNGALRLEPRRLSVGRLPMPASWVFGAADPASSEMLPISLREEPATKQVLDVLAGRSPISSEPMIELPDDRRVRLLDIELRAGEMVLTCRTEAAR